MSLGKRRQGREIALQFLFSLREQGEDRDGVLAEFLDHFQVSELACGGEESSGRRRVPEDVIQFASALCRGVLEHLEQIDGALKEISANWSLERMARVDLGLLRLGTYELLYTPNVPTSVVLNEAIEIGKRYGSRETPSFVNGILDQMAKRYRR